MATDASAKSAVVLGGVAVLLVALVGLALALPLVEAWATRVYWSLVPPSWPRPVHAASPEDRDGLKAGR